MYNFKLTENNINGWFKWKIIKLMLKWIKAIVWIRLMLLQILLAIKLTVLMLEWIIQTLILNNPMKKRLV